MCDLHGESVGCSNQCVSDSRFRGSMARIGNDLKVGLGPGPVERPGGFRRGHHVIPPLNNGTAQPAKFDCPSQKLVISFKETPVDKIVAFDTGKGQSKGIGAKLADELGIGPQRIALASHWLQALAHIFCSRALSPVNRL